MYKSGSFIDTAKDYLTRVREWVIRSPWLEYIARFGYASRGLVYMIVGALAVPVAFGAADKSLGIRGALHEIMGGWLGPVFLALVGVGLSAYVLWRLIEAIVDPEHIGTDAKGLVRRMAYVVSSAIFANLAFEAGETVVGWSQKPDLTAEDWTRFVLAQPLGRWLVAVAGASVVIFGLYQFYAAYTARFRHKLKEGEISDREETWIIGLGKFGHAARGIVFIIIGAFLILAALQSNARQAGGLSDALLSLEERPFGPWAVGIVAFGLIAYGAYVVAEARYRRIMAS